jgi:hypothetical protein
VVNVPGAGRGLIARPDYFGASSDHLAITFEQASDFLFRFS